ncbi:hypothetical protein B0H13DRAFT_2092419 [Mycena leptocephala]|nr:hypothetical protein B0H13DRAFT_2092419 [Mycena leptocephala]
MFSLCKMGWHVTDTISHGVSLHVTSRSRVECEGYPGQMSVSDFLQRESADCIRPRNQTTSFLPPPSCMFSLPRQSSEKANARRMEFFFFAVSRFRRPPSNFKVFSTRRRLRGCARRTHTFMTTKRAKSIKATAANGPDSLGTQHRITACAG